MRPEEPVVASGNARIGLWRASPGDQRVIPRPDDAGVLFTTTTFSLVNSGNKTKFAPKRSWKVDVDPGDDDDKIVGMPRLNLKSMYNDPSQMREAIAWALFRQANVPAARHTYARVAINDGYQGLYSLIEQVDKGFLRERFGSNDRGNLYKAYCGDVGCATLEHRVGSDGDDSGRQYFTRHDHPDLTYRLKTNEDDNDLNGYDDLADLARVVNAGDFGSDAFRATVEDLFDVRSFLRWASLNVLLGSWDNYFATPANYYLYNGGQRGAAKDFLDKPYFTFIPWDYDNCLGIDYFGTAWQYTDLLDWPANTKAYHQGKGLSRIPLVSNLLANHDFAQYYLDHLEHLLDTTFTPAALTDRMTALWPRVVPSAYHEADFPASHPLVTAVGGTSLGVSSSDGYLFETGWGTASSTLTNGAWDPAPPGNHIYGSGGGTSLFYAEPDYQKPVVPKKLAKANGGKPARVVPDVSLVGDPNTGMLIGQTQTFPDGTTKYSEYRLGGTSLSSPLMAGVMALADQQAGRHHGFANPALYAQYGTPAYRDTVAPDQPIAVVRNDYLNSVDASDGIKTTLRTFDQTEGLHTTPGYDDVTGVGSPNGQRFLAALAAAAAR